MLLPTFYIIVNPDNQCFNDPEGNTIIETDRSKIEALFKTINPSHHCRIVEYVPKTEH